MPSSLGLWGWCTWALLNVRKDTKNIFSEQTGSYQGDGRERVGIKASFFYKEVGSRQAPVRFIYDYLSIRVDTRTQKLQFSGGTNL